MWLNLIVVITFNAFIQSCWFKGFNDFVKVQISGPALIFSFCAGALADRYGCKRFMVFPIIGKLVSDVGMIINYAFIEKVPIELFFIEPVHSFFGGGAVFYLGKYISK